MIYREGLNKLALFNLKRRLNESMYSQLHQGKGIINFLMATKTSINSNGLILHQRRVRVHTEGHFLIVNIVEHTGRLLQRFCRT